MVIGGGIKRGSARRPISYPATLYRLDRSVICVCRIKDMSDTGARLGFGKAGDDAMSQVPQSFLLALTESQEPLNDALLAFRICEKVWTRDGDMGVKFMKKGTRTRTRG